MGKMSLEGRLSPAARTFLAVAFWLLVWQAAAGLVAESLLLPKPTEVAAALWRLLPSGPFWLAVANSLARIALGFALGLLAGCALGALSAASRLANALLAPVMQLVRATPVASFIILALVWVQSGGLSVFVSFLIVLPVLYSAVAAGVRGVDGKLLEMARVFRMRPWRRFCAIWLPALRRPLLAACEAGLGMAWKSGIAAEVVGLPGGTIGERLYQAKIFLQTAELFAWTAAVILFSWLFARGVLAGLERAAALLQKGVVDKAAPRKAAAPDAGTALPYARVPERGEGTRAICLEHLDKAFAGRTVLRDFCTVVPLGKPSVLVGPSGSGKTTLARIIMGLQAPDAGAVAGTGGLRFSCVFQEDRLCEEFSAAANVELVLPALRRGEAARALAALGLSVQETRQAAEKLSGGERRRAAIARALLAESDVVVLDEAFKGLDDETCQAAFAFVQNNLRGRTLLLIAHDAAEIEAFGAAVIPVPKLT